MTSQVKIDAVHMIEMMLLLLRYIYYSPIWNLLVLLIHCGCDNSNINFRQLNVTMLVLRCSIL